MRRFLLVHEGQRILLPEGETIIGRGPMCNIRFKDPAVSREHVRIVVLEGRAAAANLSSNGTMLNGARLLEPTRLREGDELHIGFQTMHFETVAETAAPDAEETEDAAERVEMRRPTTRTPAEQLRLSDDELTQPGITGWDRRRRLSATIEPAIPSNMSEIKIHLCPRCNSRISYNEEACATCAYAWPSDHASTRTQDVDIERVGTRRDPRFLVEVPVVYSSATLTVDAFVRDLSRGGVFIATEVLDPIGTPCDLTALPAGRSALRFTGVVAHVREEMSVVRAPGLGIQFVGGAPDALDWLERTIARFSEAVVVG